MATTLGSMSVGSVVRLRVGGAYRNFIVVQQGRPSGSYDSSFDGGTWLLMQNVYTSMAMTSGSSWIYYPSSAIHSYLNGTFINSLDADMRSVVKQVNVPCGTPNISTVACRAFILSSNELGEGDSEGYSTVKSPGTRLAYFMTDERNRRRLSTTYYTRTFSTANGDCYAINDEDGSISSAYVPHSYGVRPALVLPQRLFLNGNEVLANTAPSTPDSISVPSAIMGGATIEISWAGSSDADGNLAGYKAERSTDGGSSWSQIYQGAATSTTNNVAFGTSSVMYRVKAYDDFGLESGYKASEQVTVVNNNAPSAPPSIAVPNDVKGGSTLVISWTAASDSDGNLTGYILERSTDSGSTYTQVYKGNALTYTDTITKGWETVMYRVKAYDSYDAQSGYTTSTKRTVDNNTAPTITTSSVADLGTKSSGFTISYSVDDVDASDTLTVTETLDGTTKRTYTPTRKATNSFAVTGEYFQKITNGSHTLAISVSDGKTTTTKTVTFTKVVTAACITLAEPMEADAQITLCAITVSGSIPADAVFKVEVTNNGKDDSPVWEDATTAARNSRNHPFANQTADKGFAFNIRVTVKRGASGESGYITSVQGGFQ